MPVVFLSYAIGADSGATNHRGWVATLAARLRDEGVDVRFDGFDLRAGESLTQYMERSVAEADFVLVVCTPRFAWKANDRQGGVGYEQQIITGSILDGRLRGRVIPLLHEAGEESIPTFLKGTLHVDFRNDDAFEEGVQQLLRAIRQEPNSKLVTRPPVVRPSPRAAGAWGIAMAALVIAALAAVWAATGRSVAVPPPSPAAASPVVIAGSVVDADTFASLEGARVSVGEEQTQTDGAGTFHIVLRGSGETLVVVDRTGYEQQSIRLVVPVSSLQIALKKEKR